MADFSSVNAVVLAIVILFGCDQLEEPSCSIATMVISIATGHLNQVGMALATKRSREEMPGFIRARKLQKTMEDAATL